jgi:predicted transcriptional regulator
MPDKASETEELVLRKLDASDRMTLTQIASGLPEDLRGCPDEVARVLARLRRKGTISGEFSEKDSAWVYWK